MDSLPKEEEDKLCQKHACQFESENVEKKIPHNFFLIRGVFLVVSTPPSTTTSLLSLVGPLALQHTLVTVRILILFIY